MKPVFLVIGCPGSGKSWVCDQLKTQYDYVHHDAYQGQTGKQYVEAIKLAAHQADKPVLAEAPFSISEIKDPLEKSGIRVHPVFIQENHNVIAARYHQREGKEIPQGHLTRQDTYAQRAKEYNAFSGNSGAVLHHLQIQARVHAK